MKMTNIQMVNTINALGNFANKKLPQKISYAISRNVRKLNNDYSIYEEQLNSIYKNYEEYTLKDENGEPLKSKIGVPVIDADHEKAFMQEITDLLDIEIDVDLYTIKEDAFDYEDNGNYDILTPNEISILITLLTEKEEKKEE